MRRRILTAATTAAMPLTVALLALTGSMQARTVPTGTDWIAEGAIEQAIAADVAATKPRNEWTKATLADAGWTGCEPVAWDTEPDWTRIPVAHVVRLPVAEGFRHVRMSPTDVAARTEAFGGTATTADDVKILANCYRSAP